jgi:hypothetical protein
LVLLNRWNFFRDVPLFLHSEQDQENQEHKHKPWLEQPLRNKRETFGESSELKGLLLCCFFSSSKALKSEATGKFDADKS